MLQSQREAEIKRLLREQKGASGTELADRLGVSVATIRRDLQRLDRNGELRRVYGGAVLDEQPADPVEPPFEIVSDVDADNKEAVAATAAALVQDGEVVVLDIGTTTARVARRLRERSITVITNSLAVFDILRDDPVVRLVLLGGVVRRNYKTLVGLLTQEALRQVSADKVFLSPAGIRRDGAVVENMEVEVAQKRAMVGAGQSVVLLAPPKKFPGGGSLRICGLNDIDIVVSTDAISDEAREMCEQAGRDVITR
ncbi:MAG TPA: DeoR/GlpR family DNA-binding transcription regulator [Mycobacteriales bacterium]|nr:DeoR/GlpR family DNA-binding transcription regulator [Mycobacteriales bacterium]